MTDPTERTVSMKKAVLCGILAVVIAVGAAVPLTLYLASGTVFLSPQSRALTKKVAQIDSYVRQNFLYEFDDDAISDAVAAGYMSALQDDYAAYYNPEQYEDKQDYTAGKTAGLGITVISHPQTGLPYVVYVSRSSPAEAAGLQKGDTILAARGTSLNGKDLSQALELIAGDVGETVELTVSRDGKELSLSATLAQFEVDSVRWHIVDSIGYIQITTFNEATIGQFETALEELQKQNVTGLTFDLRGNLGGTVHSCVSMLDALLPAGSLITVQYKDGGTKVTDKSDASEVDLPMAVLVDGNTASCSEIFAMNIRDYGKGKLIGSKTYGKGIIQTTYALSDDTAVKFTSAQIVDKNGETYHGKGLTPDIEVALTEEQAANFYLLTDAEDPHIVAAVKELTK